MRSFFSAILFSVTIATAITAQEPVEDDHWAPFRPLVGKWTGERTGMGGDAKQTVEWEFVLGDQFLRCTTNSISGDDPHQDIGFISYDKQRKKFIYRAFFSEGFVNHYVADISDDGKTIKFVSEEVENGPPGLRVLETIKLNGDKIISECKLASGDQPYKLCVSVKLEKDE